MLTNNNSFGIEKSDIKRLNKINTLDAKKRTAYLLNIMYYLSFGVKGRFVCYSLLNAENEKVVKIDNLEIEPVKLGLKKVVEIFRRNTEPFIDKILKRQYINLSIEFYPPFPNDSWVFYLPSDYDFNDKIFEKFNLLLHDIKKDMEQEYLNDKSK